MASTRTLFEVLGVAPEAGLAELRAAYRSEFASLDAARGSMTAQSFDERLQLLRFAMSTLIDPATRPGYDTKLAARRTADLPTDRMGLALVPAVPNPETVTTARADALSLRACAFAEGRRAAES